MILKELSNAVGVSGAEKEARKIIREEVKGLVDELGTDTLGNLIALKKGTGKSPLRVMLAAHMDEIGFMITKVEKEGLLSFEKVGGIDDRMLLAKKVVVGEKRVPGVIGLAPIHLLKSEEMGRVIGADSLSIDVGDSGEGVSVGDYATFDTEFLRLGEEEDEKKGRVKGKAFDDRAGCAVLVELLRAEYPFDLYGVFTVQEEVGLRGAKVAAYSINPDLAFALEGTISYDLPKDEDVSPTTELGKGPAISIMDRTVIADRRLVNALVETAESEGIPYQFKQPGIGGTDSGAIHLAREGIPSVTVAVPSRYIHAPTAVLDLEDFWNTVRLMEATLKALPEKWPTGDTPGES